MPRHAILLFAHGARDPEWASPIEALRDRVALLAPDCRVALAYLEFIPPDLAGAVAALADLGIADVTIVPVFLAQGGHLKRGLPALVEGLRVAHPAMSFEVLPAIGEQPPVIEAIAACVARIAAR